MSVPVTVDLAVDISLPVLTAPVNKNIGETTTNLSWTTDETASSEVIYGLATTLNETTGEYDLSPRVMVHSANLSNLLSCTTYFFQTVSRDAAGNTLTTPIDSFTTTGCVGGANIEAATELTIVPNATGDNGTLLELSNGGARIQVSVPAGYAATAGCPGAGAYFQLKNLEEPPVVAALGLPDNGFTGIVKSYELSAYCDPDTRVTTFDQPVTVTLEYTEGDIFNLDESSLKIFRYNTGTTAWDELNGGYGRYT